MATRVLNLFGKFMPDTSGVVYPATLNSQMSLTNAKNIPCYVMGFPVGADVGGELAFYLPPEYVGSPVLLIAGVIDGTPANTFGVGCQQITIAEAATNDVAYEAEDVANNATWTGYADEEQYSISITITPTATWTAGNVVHLKVYRDDSVDTTTWDFLMTRLALQFVDA